MTPIGERVRYESPLSPSAVEAVVAAEVDQRRNPLRAWLPAGRRWVAGAYSSGRMILWVEKAFLGNLFRLQLDVSTSTRDDSTVLSGRFRLFRAGALFGATFGVLFLVTLGGVLHSLIAGTMAWEDSWIAGLWILMGTAVVVHFIRTMSRDQSVLETFLRERLQAIRVRTDRPFPEGRAQ